MVAAVTLDIFNRHCDRVFMANIAQAVNVLQAIILTKEDRMVLTPTYHVFDLYQHHMDARELSCLIDAEKLGTEKHSLPGVTASASEKDGTITVTLSNLNPGQSTEVEVSLQEAVSGASARILRGKMNEYNDFDHAPLKTENFEDYEIRGQQILVRMPACSIAELRVRI
jgi:alpha-N-arabinofuranosidase